MSIPRPTPDIQPFRTILLQIAALTALALGQPLLQLVKENPEFLSVHRSQGWDIVIFTAVLLLVVPAILAAVVAIVGKIGRRAGMLVQAAVLGGLLALTVLPILDRLPAIGGWLTLAAGAAIGLAFALGFVRSSFIRQNLAILALVVPIFMALFLGAAPIRGILLPPEAPAPMPGLQVEDPVVLIIFDELPTSSLMGPDGELDCQLFPAFCRLAEHSTWYRNATSISGATLRSVPAIMSGKLPQWRESPTLADHPENIFTLLAATHDISAMEVQTSLCPEDLARNHLPGLADRLELLLVDLFVLYQHIVVPEHWRIDLPPVADKWGNFLGTSEKGGVDNGSKRYANLAAFLSSIDAGDRPPLIVAHTLLPHSPFQFLPDGRYYNRKRAIPSNPDGTWRDDSEVIAHSYRRHLLQLVAVDHQLGRLLDRLEELDLFDAAAVVVTADHGISFKPGLHRRQYRPGNEADLMFAPLFIKAPGQTSGAIDDRFVQSLDIMPTLASALGIELPWECAGVDLLSEPVDRQDLLFMDQDARQERQFGIEIRRDLDANVAWKHALFGTQGGPERLFTAYDPGGVLGRAVADLPVAPHPTFRGGIREFEKLDAVDLDSRFVPAEINGMVEGYSGDERLVLALAVNGTIVGASRTYLDRPRAGVRRWQITVSPDVFRDGANEAELFLVDKAAPGTQLLRVPMVTPLSGEATLLGTNLGGTNAERVIESGLFGSHDWGDHVVRWTDGKGRWTIPIRPDEVPRLLELGIVSSGPPGAELTVNVNGSPLLKLVLPSGDWETSLPLDNADIGGDLTVELESTVFVPAKVNPESNDRRKLGVAVRKLVVR